MQLWLESENMKGLELRVQPHEPTIHTLSALDIHGMDGIWISKYSN